MILGCDVCEVEAYPHECEVCGHRFRRLSGPPPSLCLSCFISGHRRPGTCKAPPRNWPESRDWSRRGWMWRDLEGALRYFEDEFYRRSLHGLPSMIINSVGGFVLSNAQVERCVELGFIEDLGDPDQDPAAD